MINEVFYNSYNFESFECSPRVSHHDITQKWMSIGRIDIWPHHSMYASSFRKVERAGLLEKRIGSVPCGANYIVTVRLFRISRNTILPIFSSVMFQQMVCESLLWTCLQILRIVRLVIFTITDTSSNVEFLEFSIYLWMKSDTILNTEIIGIIVCKHFERVLWSAFYIYEWNVTFHLHKMRP